MFDDLQRQYGHLEAPEDPATAADGANDSQSRSQGDVNEEPGVQAGAQQVHPGISCDGCQMKPIVGLRYSKQLVHDTEDYCGGCFSGFDEHKKSGFIQVDASHTAADLLGQLEDERSDLLGQQRAARRDADGFDETMQNDVLELLRMWGLPWVIAPFEAEAQCAALQQLGLVDGTVTNDSDAFLFGAANVYRYNYTTAACR